MKMTKIQKFSATELQELLYDSISFRDFMIKIGYDANGSSGYENVKRQVLKLGLLIPKYEHYTVYISKERRLNDDVFVINSTYARTNLKKRIIDENLIEYRCKCGNIGTWEGKKLSLQLEHKNGINNDNRLENLEFLCPNCHSQSETFAGKRHKNKNNPKNKNYCGCGNTKDIGAVLCLTCRSLQRRKVVRPDKAEVLAKVNEIGYSATGRLYGVSDNAIRKWIKQSIN